MLLILPLGFVIVLMARLRDPQTADRVNQFFTGAEQQASSTKPRPVVADSPDDNAPTAPRARFPGVQPKLLKTIRDNTYFRNAEKDAWFHFFELLHDKSPQKIEKMHSLEADYVQLVDQPNFYRGKLVTVYGYTRQVTKQTPAPNNLGIESYYRIVVEPTDDVDWPIFVYCLELPPNLQEGDDLMSNMVVKGLFFKKLSYQSEGGMGTGPVIVARSIRDFGAGPGMPASTDSHPPIAADHWPEGKQDESDTKQGEDHATTSSASFRDILSLAGWNVERLDAFDDGAEFSATQRQHSLELLRRLRSFDSASLADWTHDGLWYFDVMRQPDDYRGQLIRLEGKVTKVTRHELSADDAQRLEMPEYYECEFFLDAQRGTATVLTTRVPKAWLNAASVDEPASASALYLKRLGNAESSPSVWLAKEVAWHPSKSLEPDAELFGPDIVELFGKKGDPRFGISVLGNLGVDVGLLDGIQGRGRIRAEEREIFYQMMRAVGQFAPSVYVDIAQATLPAVRKHWEQALTVEIDAKRRALAKVAASRAAEGRYSVAPLFNEPESQIGRLIVVDGRARRIVRVELGEKLGGGQNDVARRFGINHYYEMEVFTDDSQNYPLIFCVRKIPDDFPKGGMIDVPVRVAGFFFKDWLYRTRRSGNEEVADETPGGAGRAQYAPLLIGNEPVVLAAPRRGRAGIGRIIAGSLFLLALGGIWAAAAWFARDDRRFRERTPAANFSLPPGQSLNELNVPALNQPMIIQVEPDVRTSENRS